MSAATQESRFLRRFDALWQRVRRVRLGQTLALVGLLGIVGLGLLAAADYFWELPRPLRLAGLATVAAGVLVGAAGLARAWWTTGSRPRTAAEIERAFPKLGQSVRTVVQFGRADEAAIQAAGVRTALVAALEEDTHARSRPMYLDAIVPVRSLWTACGGLLVVAVVMLGAIAINWEWRIATQRALLAEVPYTKLAVAPGDVRVDQGQPVEIRVTVSGRTNRQVTLLTRPAGDAAAEWTEREFAAEAAESEEDYAVAFATKLDAVKRPLDYQVRVGDLSSGVHRIGIRYPLALKDVQVQLTPPEYTNQPPIDTSDPNVTAVEGTDARFAITFDQPPKAASLMLTELARRTDDEDSGPMTQSVPLELDGVTATATLRLNRDLRYSIVAESEDGQRLPENSYRIRVRADQPPEVYFEAPNDPIDVHTLAEIVLRIRVRDDFGISKAGIVFEVNNEEEYPLVTQEFAVTKEQLAADGKLAPETRAAIEKTLPLEYFQLRQTDSVAYYAFVEDNFPGTPRRTVTDLRFIDIRPFRIRYAVRDDDPSMGEGQGFRVATLEELIRRQRFNLNRTINLARKAERNERIDLTAVDAVVQSENEIAQATRELADFLAFLNIETLDDTVQLLLLAESNMLAAADSLAAGKYDTAVLQQRDALKELVEGRNRLRVEIQKNPRRFRQLAAADRRIAQKLRRPKSDKQEAAEVVRRLEQLANAQQQVQTAMAAMTGGSGGGTRPDPEAPPTDVMPAERPAESPDENPDQPPTEQPADSGANSESPPMATGSESAMTRDDLLDRQMENLLEAQDLEQALGQLKNITDLAKERMAQAREQIDQTNAAAERGQLSQAQETSEQAVAGLQELSKQVSALVQEEAAEQLNAARRLAAQLAEAQQQLAGQAMGQSPEGERGEQPPTENAGAGAKPDQDSPKGQSAGAALADTAEKNAEAGKTVLDVLNAIMRSTNPADRDVVSRVDSLLKEQQLDETVGRMGGVAEQLREGKTDEARVGAADTAERLEAAANQMAVAVRELTAPQLENLMALEQALQELRERLEQLESERAVVAWHRDAAKLLEQLEQLNIGEEAREELREQMRQAGWAPGMEQFRLVDAQQWLAGTSSSRSTAPAAYVRVVRKVNEELQAYIQELVFGDLQMGDGDATPPQYEKLVERYYQVLARQKRMGAK
jgi:hypothetical protein